MRSWLKPTCHPTLHSPPPQVVDLGLDEGEAVLGARLVGPSPAGGATLLLVLAQRRLLVHELCL